MGNNCSCVPLNWRASSIFQDNGEFGIEKRESYKISNFQLQLVNEEDPSIILNKWYHGNIDRKEVKQKLMKSKIKTRTYLVRKPITSQNCAYVLSVLLPTEDKKEFRVKNVRIYMTKSKKFYCDADFERHSVAELLNLYRDYLGEPCLITDNILNLDLAPLTYVTKQGEVEITRKLVHNVTTNCTTVELAIQNRKTLPWD